MHKETVNTFTKGMVTDTHPLTTPADILTDCLNGTLITYNGNEMILLNDMGNTTIGSAALPEGYIPIGITEYGGIIYVASYNPSTGYGLIGSFPSPLLAHMAEMWSVNVDTFTLIALNINLGQEFYGSSDSEDITRTECRAYLGLNENGLDIHILHTGDKIQIVNENLLSLPSCVQVLFGIIKKDGSIEIVEGNYLDGEEHVYTGKSSGYPLVIFKLLTLRSFNLERKYSRGENDTVNIKFIGKPEKEDPNTEVTLRYEAKLSSEITGQYTNSDGLEIRVNNLPMNGIFKYTIIPRLTPLGNLISMTKSGNIDLSKFKSDSADLRNWSYLVLDSYMKINWSFDYYNLDDDKEIRKVQFRFKPITNPTGSINVDIEKDSFNGSFEEIINFDNGIHKNDIYVVEIVGFKGSSIDNANLEVHLGNRMVYTSGIFNAFYGKIKDFTNEGFTSDLMWEYDGINKAFRKTIKVKITPIIKVTKTTEGDNIQITDPLGHVTTTTLENVTSRTFITKANETGNGIYIIDVNNKYHFEVGLKAKVIPDLSVVGTPAEATVSAILRSFTGSKLHLTDESQLIGTMPNNNSFTEQISEFLEGEETNVSTYDAGETYDTGTLTFETDLELASLMKVKSSDVRTIVVDKKGLRPLYYPDMDRSYKQRAFTAWNKDNPLFCAGADENNYKYNATLAGGNVTGGTDAGAGCDDTGLCTCMEQMDKPMVSMAAGIGGDEASYSPDDSVRDYSSSDDSSYYYRRNVAGWGCSSNEIDGGDNFLVAVWKLTDEKYRFTLLASLKQYNTNKGARLVRLDYMLRSLLSQIFTKQAFKDTIRYITTNNSEYSYYQPSIKVDIDLESSIDPESIDSINYNDVIYSSSDHNLYTNYDILLLDYTIEKWLNPLLYDESTNPTGIKSDELMTVKYDYQIEIDNCETTFATDFGITDISYMLSGANYLESINEGDDMSSDKWIYTVDWTAVDAAGRNNIYEILSDNTFRWKVDDMTPYLKLSGTRDGSGYAFVDEFGNYKVKVGDTISNLEDPLTGEPSAKNVNVAINYNTNNNFGGYMASGENYGDILRTWDGKVWPFYHSFQHVFKTYCQWKSENVSSDIFNEIVVNRDSGHIGEYNARGMWRHDKDGDAPDIVGALGNSYNSIYGRMRRGISGILHLVEDSSSTV